MKYKMAILFSTIIFLSGCIEDIEELEKSVVARDASFRKELDKRDALQKEADALKAAYDAKVIGIASKVEGLKAEKARIRCEYLEAVENIRVKLKKRKKALKQQLVELEPQLAAGKKEVRDVISDMVEVQALMDKKDKLGLTGEEVRAWNTRFSTLSKEKIKIEKNIEKLREAVGVTKDKVKLLVIR